MFKTVLIDPPWFTPGGGKSKRGSDKHYPLVKTKDLPGLIMNSGVWVINDDAHLWLWSVNTMLEDALWLMKELGFRYITNAAWVKIRNENLQFGIGRYLRGCHELLLFGTRGKTHLPEVAAMSVFGDLSVLVAERNKHSKKPVDQYELIEQVSPAPRLEIFARETHEGWASWGNEI
jgi:N6-adenosine-specific RNA methylase IME4